MFNQIGNLLPQLRDYQKLFESHERLALAITASYVDILEFCADAKAVFRNARDGSSKNIPAGANGANTNAFSVIKSLLFPKSSWRPFKTRFSQILISFEENRKSVKREAEISHMIEAQRAQELARDTILKAELEKKGQISQKMKSLYGSDYLAESERRSILAMLSTIKYRQRQRRLHNLRHPGTCEWLLKHRKYREWRASDKSSCLHCTGIRKIFRVNAWHSH